MLAEGCTHTRCDPRIGEIPAVPIAVGPHGVQMDRRWRQKNKLPKSTDPSRGLLRMQNRGEHKDPTEP